VRKIACGFQLQYTDRTNQLAADSVSEPAPLTDHGCLLWRTGQLHKWIRNPVALFQRSLFVSPQAQADEYSTAEAQTDDIEETADEGQHGSGDVSDDLGERMQMLRNA